MTLRVENGSASMIDSDLHALDYVRNGKTPPLKAHISALENAQELPGSKIVPKDVDEGTGYLYMGIGKRENRNKGFE